MTTPDTSAVRAWARDNGYTVAERGRIPAEVTDAYLAATGGSGKAPAKKAAAKKAAAKKTPAKKGPAKTSGRTTVEEPSAEEQLEQPVAEAGPQPKPSLVNDDRRLVALGEEIAALAKRVEALEQASSSGGGGKSGLFRRRS